MSLGELRVWDGLWGVASVDMDCLAVLAYARFSAVPAAVVQITACNNLWNTPTGVLPVLIPAVASAAPISGVSEIISYLRRHGYNADGHLTAAQGAEAVAYEAMLEEWLRPAMMHQFWLSEDGAKSTTGRAYARLVHFPLGLLNSWALLRRARRICENTTETELNDNACKCFAALMAHLQSRSYFFDHPTAGFVDALAYGYLAPLWHAPFPNSGLRQILSCTYPDLVKFVERVDGTYFKDVQRKQDTQAELQRTWLTSQLAKNMMAISVALGAMSLYALTTVARVIAERRQ